MLSTDGQYKFHQMGKLKLKNNEKDIGRELDIFVYFVR